MYNVKRVEIVVDSITLRELLRLLESHGIHQYSVIPDVRGRSEKGVQYGDELTDVFRDSLVLFACKPGKLEELLEKIRPLLSDAGASCLISDAFWLQH